MKFKIRELIDELNYHTDLYNKNQQVWSDQEWDKKYFELQELERISQIKYPDSPTQSIQYEVKSELQKVEHNHPMLSLDKCHSEEEIAEFVGDKDWIAMLKLDGLTCSLLYQDGKLVRAETRGDGVTGEDITHNALVVSNIPKEIPHIGELVVDGEIICDLKTFNENFADQYANARNFASGSIRLLDNAESAQRKLSFIAWDCVKGLDEHTKLSDKLTSLEAYYGFAVVPFVIKGMPNDNIDMTQDILKTMAKKLNYPIDGIVWKYDDCDYYTSLGSTAHHFVGGKAFKFVDETAETKLLDIIYDVGRTGKLTPVAIFEPVQLEGTTVEKASLHNQSIMEELSAGFECIGDILTIKKANAIIPQVVNWKHVCECAEETYIYTPEVCPICGQPTEIRKDNESKVLYCTNAACPARFVNQLDHFVGKKGLDIKGLSTATLEKLVDWGWINDLVDIFHLHKYRDEWIRKPGFGPASVDKVLAAIKNCRQVSLDKFIASLGIPLIGTTAAKDLAKEFKSWAEFIKAVKTDFKFYVLPNFGPEAHKSLKEFDWEEACELASHCLEVQDINAETASEEVTGKTFVITGKLRSYSRDSIKQLIESCGGKVVGSVSSKTNYLVCNTPENTSKYNKAIELSTPIINEEELLQLLEK